LGSRAGLDAVEKRKIPTHGRDSNPLITIAQPVAGRIPTEIPWL